MNPTAQRPLLSCPWGAQLLRGCWGTFVPGGTGEIGDVSPWVVSSLLETRVVSCAVAL